MDHPRVQPTAVILAAGAGTRLGGTAPRVPKPLTSLLGASLLARALQSVCDAGLERAVVVTGYRAAEVRAHADAVAAGLPIDVDVIECKRWREGNGASLLAAERTVGDRLIVLMADHLTPPAFVRAAATAELATSSGLLIVDEHLGDVHDLAEATKVRLDGSRISAVGKQLASFDAVDTGVFIFDRAVFDALRCEVGTGGGELSGAVQRLAGRGLMRAIRSDGSFWCDVDTPEDLAHVRGVLEREMHRGIVSASDRVARA